jgi:TonB dependent receptor
MPCLTRAPRPPSRAVRPPIHLSCCTAVVLCFDVGDTGTCAVRNADETVHQGVEIGFGVSVLKGMLADADGPDRLWLNVADTYNDFRYDGDASFGDNDLPGAPHHFLRAELLYEHPSGVFFGPNIEWVPEVYYVDSANTTKTEAYILLGLKGGYDAATACRSMSRATTSPMRPTSPRSASPTTQRPPRRCSSPAQAGPSMPA